MGDLTRDSIFSLQERMDEVEFKTEMLKALALQTDPTRDSPARWAIGFELTKEKYENTMGTLKTLDMDRRNGKTIDQFEFELAMSTPLRSNNPHQLCNFLVLALQSIGAYSELIAPFIRDKYYDTYE